MNKYKIIWHYESDEPTFQSVCVCPAKNKGEAIDFVMGFDDASVIEGQSRSNIIIDDIFEVKSNE